MVLAERDIDGYPGCSIRIVSDIQQASFYVYIEDVLGGQLWEPHNGKAALDMYNHPFAYGYVAPQMESEATA